MYVRHQGEQKHFLHLVDRAVKLCATCEIPDRSTDALLDAIDTTWVSIFGPMKVLIVDGKPGLDNESSTWCFSGSWNRETDCRRQLTPKDCRSKSPDA